MTWWEQAMRCYHEHGYLVIARRGMPYRIGERITAVGVTGGEMVDLPQPFAVVSLATEAEYVNQFPGMPPKPKGVTFWFSRIVTD